MEFMHVDVNFEDGGAGADVVPLGGDSQAVVGVHASSLEFNKIIINFSLIPEIDGELPRVNFIGYAFSGNPELDGQARPEIVSNELTDPLNLKCL